MSSNNFSIISGAEPFRLESKGKKVLLIHGFTATPTEIRPIGDYLHSKGFDIYSILLPGHGTDPIDLQSKKWIDWWQATKEVYESIDNCDYVIGFSMGGLLASRLAVEFKDKMKGVILISTFLKIKPRILNRIAFLLPVLKLIKPYLSKSPETEQFFKNNNLISYLTYPMNAVHELIKLLKFTKRKILPKITIPTLIVQGEKDDRIDPDGYKILLKLIPADIIQVELLPESQHIVTVGPDKDQLLKSIYNFLSSLEK
ncbi:MAG: alpha/beta fold hydrolase [Asgard group archaeon]|nr:alpha/beta fold hydrolase [Asgard group archaeon]